MSHKEYYQKLSLPPTPTTPSQKDKQLLFQETSYELNLRHLISEVESADIQSRLQAAIDKVMMDWADKYDALADSVHQLERSKAMLEHRLSSQSQHYERCLREMQMYYKSQQSSHQRRRSSIPFSSNISCVSGKSYLSSSSARSSSCASSIHTSFSMLEEAVVEPNFYDQETIEELSTDLDVYSSIIADETQESLPESSKITNNDSQATITKAAVPIASEDVLVFACGDGFWNTIARGKANKPEVITLVGNYLRRAGNPNVAKNSDTVKSVKEGYSLLHALVAIKNTTALRKVIDAGARVDVYPLASTKEDQMTPLMLAVKTGYQSGVESLLKTGNCSLLLDRGPYGENALHAAIQSNSDEMVIYVLKLTQQALLDKADDNGATPLHYACITGKTRLVSLLIKDCQCQTDLKDNKGETPLHYAVRNRKLKVITKMVGELGVYPNPYLLKQVPTPLDLAKSGGLKSIAEYLRSVGAKTAKEMEKAHRTVYSSNSSTFSGESSTSADSAQSQMTLGVRQYLHTKTSQILRGSF